MTESFAQLLQESFKQIDLASGTLLEGLVLSVEKDVVLVDVGLKSECAVPIEQFRDAQGLLEVRSGDTVEVVLESLENGIGETIVSRELAKRGAAWRRLESVHQSGETVEGVISGKVKGGFTVELMGLRAFLPGSLVDVRPLKETVHLEGETLEFKVIKLDQKRNNVVVSRRAVLEAAQSGERERLLDQLLEGAEVQGIVKNLTDYGAFIDLGGIDGLLHVTDMAWKRVRYPAEVVNVGDELTVKILKFDRERCRVSLGLKQLEADPWESLAHRYPKGSVIQGRITNLTDYGCFVGLEAGIEGLVHISEMGWSNKNMHPSKLVSVGDSVEVMVLELDVERRRISLGLKQCTENPWVRFAQQHNKGEVIQGRVKSVTEFGLFVGLEGDIDGLVHVSDLSWAESGEALLKQYKKGDEVTTVLLQVDPDRDRISLGIKQLSGDPIELYMLSHPLGSAVEGCISAWDGECARVELTPNVMGLASVQTHALLRQGHDAITVGQAFTALICGVDMKDALVLLGDTPPSEEPDASPKTSMSEAFRIAKNGVV